ncbi:MAG: GIY-YIG nuclease family protein [Parasphingopyxis sp.]|uniref:GIY-YIG nuclease family protein n=1 Tax=Parasphingopyxis sp. TaxID=1920299 RepID=UPI0032ED98A3
MKEDFQPTVYILANRRNGALYAGVTSQLLQRIGRHRDESFGGHSKRVQAKMLVWFEQHGTMETAIRRGKQIKKWNRLWKINLIEKTNPDWRDLAVDFGFPPVWAIR